MNPFGKREVAPEPEITGKDELRRRLNIWRNAPGRWSVIIRDTKGLSSQALHRFADGEDNLSTEILAAMTKVMLPHVVYDEASGMLKSAYDQTPTSAGRPPDPWTRPADFKISATGLAPPATPPPKVTTSRPGFLGTFFPAPVRDEAPVRDRREKFVRVTE